MTSRRLDQLHGRDGRHFVRDGERGGVPDWPSHPKSRSARIDRHRDDAIVRPGGGVCRRGVFGLMHRSMDSSHPARAHLQAAHEAGT